MAAELLLVVQNGSLIDFLALGQIHLVLLLVVEVVNILIVKRCALHLRLLLLEQIDLVCVHPK